MKRAATIATWATCVLAAAVLVVAFIYRWIPNELMINDKNELSKAGIVTYTAAKQQMTANIDALYTLEKYTANLLWIFPLKTVDVYIFDTEGIILGGMLFGAKFQTEFVYVSDMLDWWSGLEKMDIIKSVNGYPVSNVAEAERILARSKEKTVEVIIQRNAAEYSFMLEPVHSNGLALQDQITGVGTLSYINPKNNEFGGFGHGVVAKHTNDLLSPASGAVLAAQFGSIVKSYNNSPGELVVNYLGTAGTVISNTLTGVFGKLDALPSTREGELPIPIGLRNDIKEGDAWLYSTIDSNGVKPYKIKITEIYDITQENKNFLIEIIDEELLEKTGGIVSGMSGSPIVQNGKFVGCLSHVLVQDVTKGYGIFSYVMIICKEGSHD